MLADQGSNLEPPDPKSGVLPIELSAKVQHYSSEKDRFGAHILDRRTPPSSEWQRLTSRLASTRTRWTPSIFFSIPALNDKIPASFDQTMGSLIKKRRKRMRKKKHKKMMKATRWQRRAGK